VIGQCAHFIHGGSEIEGIAEESGSNVRQFIMAYREFKDSQGR
jgi:hypothetical protein